MVKYLDNNSGFNQWNAAHAQQAKSGRSIGFWGWLVLFLLSWWIIGTFFQSKKVQNEIQQPVNIEISNLSAVKQNSDKISFDVTVLRISNVALKEHKQSAGSDDVVTLLNDKNNFVEIGDSRFQHDDIKNRETWGIIIIFCKSSYFYRNF